jgi:hypothetical protein
MSWLYPLFFAALASIAIPIIIHLFNFRRFKRIYFTNVALLQEVQQETRSQRNLKHILVLMARIFAIVFLVLAFVQPFIPAASGGGQQGVSAVSVYIDNTFSMSGVGKEGELLQASKNKAREIADAYSSTDLFQLLTADFEGKHQRLVSREDFLRMVDEVEVSPASRNLSEIVARQKEALNKEPYSKKIAYILSDYQQNMVDVEAINSDSTILTELVKLQANPKANLSVDSVWLITPYVQVNQPAQLMVRVKNFGEEQENIPLTLKINEVQKGLANFSIAKNETKTIEMTFTATTQGWQNAVLEMMDAPVSFDDKLYFSFEVKQEINILSIYPEEESNALGAVYGKIDEYYNLTQVSDKQLDYSAFPNYSLIVLDGVKTISSGLNAELNKFVTTGGTLIAFPPAEEKLDASLNEFLGALGARQWQNFNTQNQRVNYLNAEHPVFRNTFEKLQNNIDKPVIQKYFNTPVGNGEPIMRLQNGQVFLSHNTKENGNIYIFNSPLNNEWNNFSAHALFVPVMLNIALNSVTNPDLFYTIGEGKLVKLNLAGQGKDQVYKLKLAKTELIPQMVIKENKLNLSAGPELKNPGNYTLSGGDKDLGVRVAFNYDRKESENTFYSEEELNELITSPNIKVLQSSPKGVKQAIIEADKGVQLWRYCIAFSLFFLLCEVLLLRFLK